MNMLQFLKLMEGRITPEPGTHYALMCTQYGSDATGWEDRLTLVMNNGYGKNLKLFFDEDDLVKPTEQLVDECVDLIYTEVTKMLTRGHLFSTNAPMPRSGGTL